MSNQFTHYLENAATGQAYPAVRASDIAAYRFFLPPLAEQRAIAATLDSIEEAIQQTDKVRSALRAFNSSVSEVLLTGRSRINPTVAL